MLSYASGILGQSLVENMGGKNAIRREALEAFLKSARYIVRLEHSNLKVKCLHLIMNYDVINSTKYL